MLARRGFSLPFLRFYILFFFLAPFSPSYIFFSFLTPSVLITLQRASCRGSRGAETRVENKEPFAFFPRLSLSLRQLSFCLARLPFYGSLIRREKKVERRGQEERCGFQWDGKP